MKRNPAIRDKGSAVVDEVVDDVVSPAGRSALESDSVFQDAVFASPVLEPDSVEVFDGAERWVLSWGGFVEDRVEQSTISFFSMSQTPMNIC